MPLDALVGKCLRRAPAGQLLDLVHAFPERVSAIRLAGECAHANDGILVMRGGDADLDAEFVRLVRLPDQIFMDGYLC